LGYKRLKQIIFEKFHLDIGDYGGDKNEDFNKVIINSKLNETKVDNNNMKENDSPAGLGSK
jgi:hypothetical protein